MNRSLNVNIYNGISEDTLVNIIKLDSLLLTQSWTLKMWKNELRKDGSRAVLCYLDKVLVGFCLFSIGPLLENCDLYKIAVLPAYHRRGFASKILQHTTDYLSKAGVKWLFLDVECHNFSAINMYKSLNFQALNRRESYYTNGSGSFLMGLEI